MSTPKFRAGLDRTPMETHMYVRKCDIELLFDKCMSYPFILQVPPSCYRLSFYHIIHVVGTICRINFTILILLKICLVRKRKKKIALCNKLMLCFPQDFWKIFEGRIFLEIIVIFHGFRLQLFSKYFQL